MSSSLSSLIKEHNTVQQRQRDENERKRRIAKESMMKVTAGLVYTTNNNIGQVFRNQQALENESKLMHQQTQLFAKQTQSWLQSFQQLNDSLKELGDIENWATHLQSDVEMICTNVDQILMARHQQHQQQQQ